MKTWVREHIALLSTLITYLVLFLPFLGQVHLFDWDEINFYIRSYLVLAVAVLMLITSMGIFGFLSKAHLEHSISTGGTNELRITNLERQIGNQQRTITDAEKVLSQLDQTVQVLLDADRIRGKSGALATRKGQSEERSALNENINAAYDRIEQYQEELTPLTQEKLAIEVEVGPLKYIAELIYGDEAGNHFDEAVRWVILLLIFVFDPLAVALLLVASRGFAVDKKPETFYQVSQIVDPSNVVDVEDNLTEVIVEDEIPIDEDVSEYEVVEQEDPTEVIRGKKKHEDGWYTQGGTPTV
mgnify:CR=1 FL=1